LPQHVHNLFRSVHLLCHFLGSFYTSLSLLSSGTFRAGHSKVDRRMRRCIWAASVALAAVSASAVAQSGNRAISITPAGAQKVITGASERFTGSVRVQSLFDPQEPTRLSGGQVTFQPGARSAWHTHPLGQVLIVTKGEGWVQEWGGPIQVMRKGDVVWIPPNVKHWHGATPTSAVTHIALQEQMNGVAVVWLEKVTDAQYRMDK
jgi:quercetin dioxygenase-like cupin family protein